MALFFLNIRDFPDIGKIGKKLICIIIMRIGKIQLLFYAFFEGEEFMKNRRNFMSLTLLLIVLAASLLMVSAAPYSESVTPEFIQGAYYTSSYQCFYMNEDPGEAKNNKWQTYSLPIKKENMAYDGMNGSWFGMKLLRIKVGSPAPGDSVAVYIDNIKMLNEKGDVLFCWDFNDGKELHGPYLSQGTGLDSNMKIVDLDGEKCFLLHGKTKSMYGNNGIEIQWELPMNPDHKKGLWIFSDKKKEYTLQFDYYYAIQ